MKKQKKTREEWKKTKQMRKKKKKKDMQGMEKKCKINIYEKNYSIFPTRIRILLIILNRD
jgi:hypothetical protein